MEPARRTVLVVEDEPAILELLESCLKDGGYSVLAASSVDGALAIVRNASLSAAVVDLHLPRGSGRDVVAALPESTPVIIFSGMPEESSGLETTRPRTVLVAKPYSTTLLLELLGQAMSEE
jgi:two-component system cell cycle sensor histidine kinase/response regulator CckA